MMIVTPMWGVGCLLLVFALIHQWIEERGCEMEWKKLRVCILLCDGQGIFQGLPGPVCELHA